MSISAFFPIYNEEKVIEKVLKKADRVLRKKTGKYEIVAVDDGSTDGTNKVLRSLKRDLPALRVVVHKKNKGYGGAIKTGLKESKYEWVVFTDSDGQFDFKEIESFLAKKDEADLIIGFRKKRNDGKFRLIIAKMLKVWNLLLFGVWFKDADCGFKLIKKPVIDMILPKILTESAITETEFLIRAKRAGFKFVEVGVNHYPRIGGASTGANPKVIGRAVKESFKLWQALRK